LARGYEDLLDGRISDDFWARKSKAWEAECCFDRLKECV